MKKFFKVSISLICVAFIVNLIYTNLSDKGKIMIIYADLRTPGRSYGEFVTMKPSEAFPEKVMSLMTTVDPKLDSQFKELQKDLKEIDTETTSISSHKSVIALRKASKIVTVDEYYQMIVSLGSDIGTDINTEDLYGLWKKYKKQCNELRKIIPYDPALMQQHAIICMYLDDIEQVENYRKHRDKEDTNEYEKQAQTAIQEFIGMVFLKAMEEVSNTGEIFNELGLGL